ncbi:hypothetical protein KAREA_14310 [Prescottella equi]|nr:hypothetical protein RE9414_13560 [Prescottella equi]BCN82729.1 hypothetical protein RE0356_13700 [Prescottella equi]BDC71516.1 hypothetical protein KAREA_14310 [Prescottella equi]
MALVEKPLEIPCSLMAPSLATGDRGPSVQPAIVCPTATRNDEFPVGIHRELVGVRAIRLPR